MVKRIEDEEEMIRWYEENNHHLFSKDEIRGRLIDIFEPVTKEDYNFIDKETAKVWKDMPKYKINKQKHSLLHKKWRD